MGEILVLPARHTLADKTYIELKSRIMQSLLEPGAKLSIDGLTKQMTVSQTPIREALARLEAEGLVERRPLSGYTVTPLLTKSDFNDLFELRLLMEPLAAKRAAVFVGISHNGVGDGTTLTHLARSPEALVGDAKLDQLAFTESDIKFHAAVAEHSGSPLLAKAISGLDAHIHLHRAYLDPVAIEETEVEHLAIAEAIIAQQPLAAEEAMRVHLARSRERHAAAFTDAAREAVAKPKRAKK